MGFKSTLQAPQGQPGPRQLESVWVPITPRCSGLPSVVVESFNRSETGASEFLWEAQHSYAAGRTVTVEMDANKNARFCKIQADAGRDLCGSLSVTC